VNEIKLESFSLFPGNDYELLQAPQEEIEKFKFINNTDRQKLGGELESLKGVEGSLNSIGFFCILAMVSKMDESIGKVVDALKQKGMLENSIIMFYSDNGAPTTGLFQNAGSNYPLRGVRRALAFGRLFDWFFFEIETFDCQNDSLQL
jgi:arylsulfatase B